MPRSIRTHITDHFEIKVEIWSLVVVAVPSELVKFRICFSNKEVICRLGNKYKAVMKMMHKTGQTEKHKREQWICTK